MSGAGCAENKSCSPCVEPLFIVLRFAAQDITQSTKKQNSTVLIVEGHSGVMSRKLEGRDVNCLFVVASIVAIKETGRFVLKLGESNNE